MALCTRFMPILLEDLRKLNHYTGNGTSLGIVELQPDGKWLIKICSLTSDEPPRLD
jgi:hypothetical protein